MEVLILRLADQAFLWFHAALVIFHLFGWIWAPLRKAHLVALGLTAGSWFVLGLFYGIGYCPLTDWHFDVLQRLGARDLPRSYITYLIGRTTGLAPEPDIVALATTVGFFAAIAAALVVSSVAKWRTRAFPWRSRISRKP